MTADAQSTSAIAPSLVVASVDGLDAARLARWGSSARCSCRSSWARSSASSRARRGAWRATPTASFAALSYCGASPRPWLTASAGMPRAAAVAGGADGAREVDHATEVLAHVDARHHHVGLHAELVERGGDRVGREAVRPRWPRSRSRSSPPTWSSVPGRGLAAAAALVVVGRDDDDLGVLLLAERLDQRVDAGRGHAVVVGDQHRDRRRLLGLGRRRRCRGGDRRAGERGQDECSQRC